MNAQMYQYLQYLQYLFPPYVCNRQFTEYQWKLTVTGLGLKQVLEVLEVLMAHRAVRVTQQGRYSGPYVLAEDQEPFISSAELVEFEPPEPPMQDSGPYLRAARDLP
jgi:hypothetical protein